MRAALENGAAADLIRHAFAKSRMRALKLTIAICTWNRAKSLRTTLLSLQQLIVPSSSDWEILIVDNNCSDDTSNVIDQFVDLLPIRLVHETRQGLSHARNCAVGAAKGDYILWTDDDVIVDPYWLGSLRKRVLDLAKRSAVRRADHVGTEGKSSIMVS